MTLQLMELARRGMMWSALFLVVAGGAGTSVNAESEHAPNVLLILVDDLGYSDLSSYGGEIRTPHIDSLARDGLLMTQFYNASRCSVSRASIMTGLYHHQAGVGANNPRGTPEYQAALNHQSVTLAEVLREAGYATYLSGKWHLGEADDQRPQARGFDRSYGILRGMSMYFNHHRRPGRKGEGPELTIDRSNRWEFLLDDVEVDVPETTMEMWARNEGYYTTDAFTEYAMQFLDEHEAERAQQPWFLYLAYTAPHWPLQAFPEDIAKYQGVYDAGWDRVREMRYQRQLELGVIDPQTALAPRTDQMGAWETASESDRAEFIREMEVYAGMVDRIDQNVGRVLAKLDAMGVSENTMVIFLSDNGGAHTTRNHEGLPAHLGSPRSVATYSYIGANVSNTPFRLQKQYVHEGGIATPFLVRFPREIPAGLRGGQVAHIVDLMPTLLDYTGASYPRNFAGYEIRPLVGQSLRPAMEGRELSRVKPWFWEHRGNKGVRQGNWKLVAAHPSLEWELYNMAEDRTEVNDLAATLPAKRDELAALYADWAEANRVLPPVPGEVP
ncbi:MAG: arylsulfatase [Synoicihabitans sp.]